MTKSGLPNSLRKFLRMEKARFRREVSDAAEADQKIKELVMKIHGEYRKSKGSAKVNQ